MVNTRLEYLFRRYVQKKNSKSELAELIGMIEKPENKGEVNRLIDETFQLPPEIRQIDDQVANYILSGIIKDDTVSIAPLQPHRTRISLWVGAAAMVIMVIFSYWLIDNFGKTRDQAKIGLTDQELIVPGRDRAILTLANGSTIFLDSVQNGSIQQSGLKMRKQNGMLIFESVLSENTSASTWNTISTPRGGQYRIGLPDGSEVWLNASSLLRFPNSFSGKERVVEISGEAYFEVARDTRKPFRVGVGNMQVTVLGTHFNVNAYPDEQGVKTSLFEGSVKISEGKINRLLKPGQQAIVRNGKTEMEINRMNKEEVLAWKNGLFIFNGADITTIMNQIARWYDVRVTYDGSDINRSSFEGKISRSAPLTDVLKILELSGVKFTVVGKQIIVG